MNEFRLQKALTSVWASQGLTVDGQRLYLAAWEVMADWRINDAARHWNRPSVDFVCLDSVGRLVLIELKVAVSTPQQAWSALCQVTHRAVELAQNPREPVYENLRNPQLFPGHLPRPSSGQTP